MLIYGHRSHEIDIAIGEFYCPNCQAQRSFKHKRIDRYLTLFFISTIRLGRLGEYVQCQTCLKTFETEVLAQAARITLIPPNYTRQGCFLTVLGGLAFVIGVIVGLFTVFVQLTDEAGPGNNVEGFIGVLVLCPTPLVILGLLALIGGLFVVWRNRKKTNAKV